MARIEPLPIGAVPEVEPLLRRLVAAGVEVPNSYLAMQRRPRIVEALAQLAGAVFDPDGTVPQALKPLIAHAASAAAGCRYCQAHTAVVADRMGAGADRIAELADFAHSDRFSDAERVALEFALAAASVPNGVTDGLVERLRAHWDDGQIVEILAVVSLYGFLNRWNDSLATPLEPGGLAGASRLLAGWEPGKHA